MFPVMKHTSRALLLALATLACGHIQAQESDAPAAAVAAEPKAADLLFYLDDGETQRQLGAYEQSRKSWLAADDLVRGWEDEMRRDGAKILGDIGSYIINDKTRRYDGRDYEKVFLSVRLALDHLALGDWQAARTEIKKMHEREAIIAEIRAKELEAVKKEAESKGLTTTSFKELNGYPIETLEDPAVRALKNAYESAYANYIAGFVYEALGEPSLAAAGYRKAAEMQPGVKLLEDSLKELDGKAKRNRGKHSGQTDVLFLVETGTAPKLDSITLPIPLPIVSRGGLSMVMTPLSWPVIRPTTPQLASNFKVNGKDSSLALLTNVDLMARRALSDEMPGIIFRTGVRAIVKGVAQKNIQDNAGSLGLFGSVLSIAASVVAVATETADTRIWQTLPGYYSVARMTLPSGAHTLTVDTPSGPISREIKVSGPYAVVALRSSPTGTSLAQTPYIEAPAPIVAEAGQAITPAAAGKKKK